MVNGRPEDPRALSPLKSQGCVTPACLPLRTNLSACQGPCPSIAPFYPSLPFVLALTVCQALGFRCCHIQSEQAHEVSTAAFCSSTFEKTEYPSKKRVCPRLTIREELGSEPSPLPCTLSQGDGPFLPAAFRFQGQVGGGLVGVGPGARQKCREKRYVMLAAQWPPPLSEGAELRNDTGPLSAPGAGGCAFRISPARNEQGDVH